MKTTSKMISTGLWLVVTALGLTGCASTPEARVDKNTAMVASWPADVQAQVRAGKVAIGFAREQVWVALGEPDQTLTRTDAQASRDVWVYLDRGSRFRFGLGVGAGGVGSSVGGGVGVNTGGRGPRELMRVVFDGGKVSAIEQMKK
jgi:hypothetical protein